MDSKLSFHPHIKKTVKEASRAIFALRKVRGFLDTEAAKCVYTSMIRPKLEYCSTVIISPTMLTSTSLEKCQNNAMRVISRFPLNFSMTTAQSLLGIHTLGSRWSVKFYKFVRKVDSGVCSPYLKDCLTRCQSHGFSLRNNCTYVVPHVRTDFGKRSFIYNAIVSLKSLDSPRLSFDL